MVRLGRWTLLLALVLIVAGLLGGFGMMIAGVANPLPLLGLVPLGFVLGFAGLAMVVLHGPRGDESPRSDDPDVPS